MLIDRRLLGADVTIDRVDVLPRLSPVRIVLHDVKLKQPAGFSEGGEYGEDMATVERAELDFDLIKLLWTWISPRSKVIDIKGIRLLGVHVIYAMRSPEQGLQGSNVFELVRHVRSLVGSRKKAAAPSSEEPCFQLRELRTFGLSASLFVVGVNLPSSCRRLSIVDLNFTDFMGEIRGNILRHVQAARAEGSMSSQGLWRIAGGIKEFISADSWGGGLVSFASLEDILGGILERLNAQILEQAQAQAWNSGADLVGSSFASTAQLAEKALGELDADGDGSISASEVASALWRSLAARPPAEEAA